MEQNPIVWKIDEESEWGLYCNPDAKLPKTSEPSENALTQIKGKGQDNKDNPFHIPKIRAESKGFPIYTPKGYGIIQSISLDSNTVSVKVDGTVYEFPKQETMNEIPLQVVFFKESARMTETVLMPINSTTSDLTLKIKSSLDKDEDSGVKLYYQGKSFEESTHDSLEKLKIPPYSRFLATIGGSKLLSCNRFKTINDGWYYDEESLDGITITPSKRIKLKGFSIYRGEKGFLLNPQIQIIEGATSKGAVLYSESYTLSNDFGGSHEKICVVMMNKYLTFEAGSSFSLTFKCQQGQSYYGSGGVATVEGEGDVSFTFKECEGAHNGTAAASGQFPEIFYTL